MLTTVLVFVITLLVMLYWTSRPRNAPPSPGLSLPVVGHLYLFRGNPVEQFNNWRKKLGDIYTVQMGSFRYVILSGYQLTSEALIKNHDSLLGRPDTFLHKELFKLSGIVSSEGDNWKEQRAFLNSALRSLGFGRNIMAERIRIEADYLVETIKASEAEPIDVENITMVCVTNVIAGVIFGKRYKVDDENIIKWLSVVRRLIQALSSASAINIFPALKYIPGDYFRYNEMCSIKDDLSAMLLEWTDKDNRHINVLDQEFEDLTQAYLTEIERKKQEGVATTFNEKNFLSSILGLFNAGSETTTTTIRFAIIYMLNFPETQRRLYHEIKEKVGTDRALDISDKPKLTYLSAFIMETQRYSSVVPLSVDRLATKDIHLGGYTVPKGTTIMANLESTLFDKDVWGDPENFRPERFLSEDGAVVYKKELVPFGLGKRNCLAESLALMELYVFLSALIQTFEFQSEEKDKAPSMESSLGIARNPYPFKIRAVLRKH